MYQRYIHSSYMANCDGSAREKKGGGQRGVKTDGFLAMNHTYRTMYTKTPQIKGGGQRGNHGFPLTFSNSYRNPNM